MEGGYRLSAFRDSCALNRTVCIFFYRGDAEVAEGPFGGKRQVGVPFEGDSR